jgi:3-phenylpropionate/trans-cinnamate dioxygenase ferredoxin subunit
VSEVRVGALDELKEVTVVSDGLPEQIAVYKLPSGVYAISDTCTHEQTELSDGDVDADDETVECMMHGAVFHIPTGEVRALPATRPVQTYPTIVRDGDVFIEVNA